MSKTYSQSTNHLYSLAKNVFSLFTREVGGNEYEMSIRLHERFTVDDFAYHEDMVYHGVYKYFQNVVIPHKINVFYAGIELLKNDRIELFLTAGEREKVRENLYWHDLSKFCADEAFGYAQHDFKNPNPKTREAFELAWHHHKMNNPHHPEHWMNPNRSGQLEPLEIPNIYLIEMLADWIGAGRTYGSTLVEWLPNNLPKFKFGINTHKVRSMLKQLLNVDTWVSFGSIPPVSLVNEVLTTQPQTASFKVNE